VTTFPEACPDPAGGDSAIAALINASAAKGTIPAAPAPKEAVTRAWASAFVTVDGASSAQFGQSRQYLL
jgi:hypothetical protein